VLLALVLPLVISLIRISSLSKSVNWEKLLLVDVVCPNGLVVLNPVLTRFDSSACKSSQY
jgi:hypothetical protein